MGDMHRAGLGAARRFLQEGLHIEDGWVEAFAADGEVAIRDRHEIVCAGNHLHTFPLPMTSLRDRAVCMRCAPSVDSKDTQMATDDE